MIPVGAESDVAVREPDPLRYKAPESEHSELLALPVIDEGRTAQSVDFRFQSAVAEFGLLLRRSPHRGGASFGRVAETARAALGADREGYRAEFVSLAEGARGIDLATSVM